MFRKHVKTRMSVAILAQAILAALPGGGVQCVSSRSARTMDLAAVLASIQRAGLPARDRKLLQYAAIKQASAKQLVKHAVIERQDALFCDVKRVIGKLIHIGTLQAILRHVELEELAKEVRELSNARKVIAHPHVHLEDAVLDALQNHAAQVGCFLAQSALAASLANDELAPEEAGVLDDEGFASSSHVEGQLEDLGLPGRCDDL
jgi:hypothetical protein